MLTKLNRQETIRNFPSLPLNVFNRATEDYDFHYPKSYAYYVLTLESVSFKGHVNILSTALPELTIKMGYDYLVFLGDSDAPWLYRTHKYKPAKDALQYLADNKISKRFNGALIVNRTDLPTFLKHLAWMVRTNAVLSTVHFTDNHQGIVANICQYGNLHISALTKETDARLKQVITESTFAIQKDGNCKERFAKKGKIAGRTLAV